MSALARMLFVFALTAFAARADLLDWADKLSDQFMEDAEKEQFQILVKEPDPAYRVKAAKWMGGRREPRFIAALAGALSDRDARVREAAASGLWESDEAAAPARAQLVKALDDTDPNVVAQAAGALQAIGMKESELASARKRVFAAPDASLSSRFLVSRNLIGVEPAPRLLEAMLAYLERHAASKSNAGHHNTELAQKALERLAKTQDRSLVAPLIEAARTARAGHVVILRTLGLFQPKPEGFTPLVLEFLQAPDPKVRYAALSELRGVKREQDIAVWVPRAGAMLSDPDDSVRSEALWALGGAKGLAAGEIDKVVAALGDRDKSVRINAARAIGEIGEQRQPMPAAARARVLEAARPALQAAMEKDPEADVRSEAERALRDIGSAKGAPTTLAAAAPSSTSPAAEAAGMAVLRRRKVTFEEGSFYQALSKADAELVAAFLDAGMSSRGNVAGLGPPLRAMLFGSETCNARVRPTPPETKAVMKLLLDRGADPNGSDEHGNTALMEAASHGCDREVMRILLKAGAKLGTTNRSGLTAFEMGLYSGHDGLEELIAAGYRLPPDKAKMYAEGYAGKPAVQAMIKKASRK